MIVSGLTILKNAVRLDYPFRESIRSLLPMCQEVVVVVGASEDGTLDAVKALADPRIRIVESVWSDRVQPRKGVLAQQTNVGLHLCMGDWVVYLQANEVLHEQSLPGLLDAMDRYRQDSRVEALLLERLSFWGDYEHVCAVYPERFKYTARIVRPYIGTYSIRDAMSFAVFDGFSTRGRYPRAADTGQDVFRYGYVGSAGQYQTKVRQAAHTTDSAGVRIPEDFFFRHVPRRFVRSYTGPQPAVMRERIEACTHRLRTDDPRWRTTCTAREWLRAMETRIYERWGVPRWRTTRYRLVGSYRAKDRSSVA